MRRILTAVLLPLALLGGACGGDGDSGGTESGQDSGGEERERTPREIVLASSSKTIEDKSSRMSFQMKMTGQPELPEGLTITGDGAFDYVNKRGAMTMTIPPVGGMEIGQIQAVFDGNTIYQKFPQNIAQFLGGKPWIKIDLNAVGKMSGVDLSTLMQAQSSDPTQAFQYLQGAADDVSEVGKEELRGDETTHYKMTLDFNRVVASAPAEQQEALRQAAEMYGDQKVPADVWVDEEDRLRRMSFVVDMSKLKLPEGTTTQQAKPTGTMTYNMELFEFGVSVDAAAPPADQVTDLGALLSASAGG
jgi:hypothetical protein